MLIEVFKTAHVVFVLQFLMYVVFYFAYIFPFNLFKESV